MKKNIFSSGLKMGSDFAEEGLSCDRVKFRDDLILRKSEKKCAEDFVDKSDGLK